MARITTKRVRAGIDSQLATLMRAVVDARFQLERARDRLHRIDQKLRQSDSDANARQREKALGEYIVAVGEARAARYRLLKQLQDHKA